jgi:hypothetical protein
MNEKRKVKIVPGDDWSRLEGYLRQNFQPVDPRAVFIDDLRKNLETVGFNTKQNIEKTKKYLVSAFALITGLVVIALFVRFAVIVISSIKTRGFRKTKFSAQKTSTMGVSFLADHYLM